MRILGCRRWNMAYLAALAGLFPIFHLMAFPAVFMNDDLCAMGFIGNIRRRIMMTIRTGLSLGHFTFMIAMANSAIDPEIIEIILMGNAEFIGIDFVMTGLTFNL